ncbi:glycosyltransferase family 9 protein [Vibrio porteresiae]|uniref:Glycosyltransferase family 9 protein n=1 Tax=Vibrio porteresiae DSM 19223 TaxID=1123496 RepID=A0ABZ0QEN3_9VIBR|nr:glycosyltransferase family 9 protein [Vibrio porteresiae]WPC74227.1 glycosyltransferase family 9 protein [Vibrio porteresiae DSM 19223]
MTKIAIFNVGRKCFGNTVLQLPFFIALKQHYPDCHITLFTSQQTSQVLLFNGCVDQIISDRKVSPVRLASLLKSGGYDLLFNLRRTSGRIHLSCALSGMSNKYAYTTNRFHDLYYRKNVVFDKCTMYPAVAYLSLLNDVTDSQYKTDIIRTLIPASDQRPNALTLLPGGSSHPKKWPIGHYIKAAELLVCDEQMRNKIKQVNIVLGPQEEEYLSQIPESIGAIPVCIHKQPNVKQLVELASQSVLALSNDCGPGHIFQMSKVPMVVLFGWIDGVSPYHVIQEWFLSHDNSCAVTPDSDQKSIETIPVNKVVGMAKVVATIKTNSTN